MTFLNAGILGGIAMAAAIPAVIHLLNKQFPKLFEFSSIALLRETQAQRSRIYKWRHRILLALRTLMLALLIAAFLKPVLPRFGGLAATNEGRTVLLVLDHSHSMEHGGGGQSARQRALTAADQVLAGLGSADVCNVVLAGDRPTTAFFDWSRNHAEARRFLQNVKPGAGGADFSLAAATAARLLGKEPRNAEVYFFSDFQRKNWAGADLTTLPPVARLFFTGAAAAERENHAILSVATSQQTLLAGDTLLLEVELGNFAATPFRGPVKVVLDGGATFEKEAYVAAWSSTKFSLPIPTGSAGLHLCEVSLPPDELPGDDRSHLVLRVAEKEGVLLVTDAPAPEKDAPHFLKTALNPYENLAGSLMPEQVPAAKLDAARLAAVRKVIVARAGPLAQAQALALADFAFHGGGVLWFLDGPGDAASLEALREAAGTPLPLALGKKRETKSAGTGAQQIARGDFGSRFLRLFRGTRRQDLALLEFYDIHDCAATGAGKVLLHFADDTPALAELPHGLGTLLFLNFSAGELSSNLARQRAFPAWLHEMLKNLTTSEPAPAAATVGEVLAGEAWKAELAAAPFRQPDGTPLALKTEALGERVAFSFPAEQPGFYSLRTPKLAQAFAVNTPADEADLRALDAALLPKQTGAAQGFVVAGREDLADLVNGRPLWQWFILGAVAVLLAELLFQLWLRRTA